MEKVIEIGNQSVATEFQVDKVASGSRCLYKNKRKCLRIKDVVRLHHSLAMGLEDNLGK